MSLPLRTTAPTDDTPARSAAGADVRAGALEVVVAGARLLALRAGGLWWAAERTLVVSDLHLGKADAYARRGVPLPPWDTRATLASVAALVHQLDPLRVVSLGDSFHDLAASLTLPDEDRARLCGLTAAVADWVWVEGNHDPAPPPALGGRHADVLQIGPLHFRHEPVAGVARGEVAGHLHPCVRVGGGGRSQRCKAFATDGSRLVMPAMGAFTGGLNVRDRAFEPLFPQGWQALAVGRTRVARMGARHLLAD
jgi:DNA ligase-associated metallophosphoesterase